MVYAMYMASVAFCDFELLCFLTAALFSQLGYMDASACLAVRQVVSIAVALCLLMNLCSGSSLR